MRSYSGFKTVLPGAGTRRSSAYQVRDLVDTIDDATDQHTSVFFCGQ